MKKLFFVLVMLLVFTVLHAQPMWFKATAMRARALPSGEWSSWMSTTIPVYFDAEAKHIEVYSEEKQIIDFAPMISERVSGVNIYGSYGTDSKYRSIYVILYFFDSGELQLHISYDNLEYVYQLVDYEQKGTFY